MRALKNIWKNFYFPEIMFLRRFEITQKTKRGRNKKKCKISEIEKLSAKESLV